MHQMSFIRGFLLSCLLLSALVPHAFAQAPGEPSAVRPSDCNHDCLIGFARGYMDALAHRDPSRVPFARTVRFTENNVELRAGREGLWATVTGVPDQGLVAADTTTGQAAWIGHVQEHGLPVYYGMRLQVRNKQITEVETIVVRRTGLPLPFGDVSKLVHDPSFAEVLPPEERRPRERLVAVADSYFNTVELNDGMVFAPFHADCARLENGLLTTSRGSGSSGDIAQGCEAQFRLGIYRINKRIRERRYPLVDVERGVVVATGFFDHANEFDRYKTTDGKEMKTLLKWPNSISLVEAFKIRDGKISRIEAVFTYVPYFMHSPFYPVHASASAIPQAAPDPSAAPCDRECLIGFADRYMEALVRRDPGSLPWAPVVRFTENSVPLMIGEGLWGSIRKKWANPLRIADPSTGNVVWFGVIEEHDAPAYYGMRLKVQGGRISEVETVVSRKFNPGPFGDPAKFQIDPTFDAVLAPAQRQSRERLQSLVDGYFATQQRNDGTLFTQIDPACQRRENGEWVTQGKGGSAVIVAEPASLAKGCEAQLRLGLYRPMDRFRDRRFPVIDVERGLVVAMGFADFSVADTTYTDAKGRTHKTRDAYPSSREAFEIFSIRDGRISRIDALSVFQPLGMPSPWRN
ncbi:MAG: hypothetical protein IRZ28_10085 [Steroidobacteraceae bacterium]|nr:hypothetical protein [Steroidobacteraceae bacterium]